ncbi:isoaspartyl peptidase/L-asparaginase-like [Ctenocephalides felis]|uniref:isoaspartyl peptidase/L-asparaginase-like n=1 Tax=Ctenocephalides felis TaxID=7515 RepID=UPI000E6E4749|nr:isoaspartyl peptidase/L-asparaginase-like [Ctenocephalides felis]
MSSGDKPCIIVVHGGAGDIPDERVPGKFKGVKLAARIALEILKNGGTSIEATEAAIRSMEDDENFNAGYGSVLTIEGNVEMSASMMHGEKLQAGAVGYLKNIAHPISLARKVMEKTPHVLLCAEGATHFAEKEGFDILPEGSLVTEMAKKALQDFIDNGGIGGTVGAVALDCYGNLTASTSTGGITGKYRGRVGDTPQLGSGTYADNKLGAVSTTGHGESILKVCLAHSILMRMHLCQGMSPDEAAKISIDSMQTRLNNTAGAIVLSPTGERGVYHNSKRMAWASCKLGDDVLEFGIEQGQCETEPL